MNRHQALLQSIRHAAEHTARGQVAELVIRRRGAMVAVHFGGELLFELACRSPVHAAAAVGAMLKHAREAGCEVAGA